MENFLEYFFPLQKKYFIICFSNRFAGGHGEAASHVGEGLATALQCLQDITSFRNPSLDKQGMYFRIY